MCAPRGRGTLPVGHTWGYTVRTITLAAATMAFIHGFAPAPAGAQTALQISGLLFADDGELDGEERIGPTREANTTEVGNEGVFGGEIAYLHSLSDRPLDGFRVGGDLRFLGDYAVCDDEGDVFGLGPLFELAARADWSVALLDRFALTLGLRLGLAAIFPSDDLADAIDALRAQGADIGTGPRVGFVLSPGIAGRYQILDRLIARLDLRFTWEQLFLIDVDQPVQGVAFERTLDYSLLRFEFVFGVEIPL